MNCLVGGPLLVGGLGPGPPAPLKSGPGLAVMGRVGLGRVKKLTHVQLCIGLSGISL